MAEPKGLPRVLFDRIVEAIREIGVLVIAFAPIDMILATTAQQIASLEVVFWVGIGLFGTSLVLEALGELTKERTP